MSGTPRLIATLTMIAALAGLVLALVEEATRTPIAEQRRQQTMRALQAVLPPVDNAPDEDFVELVVGADRKGRELRRAFYRGRQEGAVVGVAFKAVAPDGYSGNIEIMVGVSQDGTVQAIEILTHAETPGLGDKIALPVFRDQFVGRNLDNIDWRVKKDGGSFDQLTGATISPRAVVAAVRSGLEFYRAHRLEIVGDGTGVVP